MKNQETTYEARWHYRLEKVELPKIDFSTATIEYIEPSEEDKRRLQEYNKKIAELRNKKTKKNG